jgi:CcmD family protein
MNEYLFAGYTVIWTVLLLYFLYLNKKQRQISHKLRDLSETLHQDHLDE